MAAYLIIDVEDLLAHFRKRGIAVDFQELAVAFRGGAALAAGLPSADKLRAIAVGNWDKIQEESTTNLQALFKASGYEVFNMPHRDALADALIIHYFSYDPDPVDELILATTSKDLLPVIRRVKTTRNSRIRMWGSENVLEGTEFADEVLFQAFESLLGIQTKNVAVYVDFENIAISLNEQGFVVNLDHLIERFVTQAKAYGQVVKMSAYAPWGQRGTLPPLVDSNGREIAEEAPSRLALANIDPVFNLPGKNSADIRIARDVMTDSSHADHADVYIIASGDRDFNDVMNMLAQNNRQVIVWGVRGSTSRQLENNPGVTVEFIEDFTNLQTHQSLSSVELPDDAVDSFTPSQWSSVIIQFDRIVHGQQNDEASTHQLVERLQEVGAVISRPRGEDLVSQAISLGILKMLSTNGRITVNGSHPIVEKTRLIKERIVRRVENTLEVRNWEYVNYGFLLKGLAMDRELERPGCNIDDQWRSHWIDCLVREQVLERKLIPHRHNPEDLVPVIKLCDTFPLDSMENGYNPSLANMGEERDWSDVSLTELNQTEFETANMVFRVIVSVEQFTSFRNFDWCPLGSLHRRLRLYDSGMSFQRAVEYLVSHDTAEVSEYMNPQSNYNTKGIALNMDAPISQYVLEERDAFIVTLLSLYDKNQIISIQNVESVLQRDWNLELWFSIMETENVLNMLPGRPGQYSLFRTHHTVNLVAEDGDAT